MHNESYLIGDISMIPNAFYETLSIFFHEQVPIHTVLSRLMCIKQLNELGTFTSVNQ